MDFILRVMCYIGFHDWEVIKRVKVVPYFFREHYDMKVCLRCGKCVDEVTPYEKRRLRKWVMKQKRIDDRRRLAKKLWDECDVMTNADQAA